MGRKVARFLPPRVGKMLVAYVTWLLPFERMLRRRCKLPEPPENLLEFMWRDGCGPRLWGTDRLSTVLARATQAGTGVRMSVARYRPIAIEMGRRIRGLVMAQTEARMEDGEEDEEDNIDVDPMTGEPIDCGGSWHIRVGLAVDTRHPDRAAALRRPYWIPREAEPRDDGDVWGDQPAVASVSGARG